MSRLLLNLPFEQFQLLKDATSSSNNNSSSNNAAHNDAENSTAEASKEENKRLTTSLQMKFCNYNSTASTLHRLFSYQTCNLSDLDFEEYLINI